MNRLAISLVVGVELPRHAQMRAIWPPNAVKLGPLPKVACPGVVARNSPIAAVLAVVAPVWSMTATSSAVASWWIAAIRSTPIPGSPIVAALVAVAVPLAP